MIVSHAALNGSVASSFEGTAPVGPTEFFLLLDSRDELRTGDRLLQENNGKIILETV